MRSIGVVINGVPLILCYLGYTSLLPLCPSPQGSRRSCRFLLRCTELHSENLFRPVLAIFQAQGPGISQCNNEKTLARHRSAGPNYFRKQPSLPTPEVRGSHLNFYS
jgi:hypothetical protein